MVVNKLYRACTIQTLIKGELNLVLKNKNEYEKISPKKNIPI